MEIKIALIDRIYDQIEEMCKFNGITVEEYIVNCVEDNFNILKYGDLNEKFKKEEKEKKTITEEKKETKKRGRPKKEEAKETEVIEEKKEDTKTHETIVENTTPIINKTKRILKTK